MYGLIHHRTFFRARSASGSHPAARKWPRKCPSHSAAHPLKELRGFEHPHSPFCALSKLAIGDGEGETRLDFSDRARKSLAPLSLPPWP